jgi:hypothetical protein
MEWVSVANNQTVSWDSLINACGNGFFNQLLAMPPSGVSVSQCVRRELIQSYVQIESGPLSGVPNNELVVKSQVVAVQETYYRLIGCADGLYYFTKVAPPVLTAIGQRYALYGTTNLFFTWDGFSQFSYRPAGYIHGLVTVGRFIGCP